MMRNSQRIIALGVAVGALVGAVTASAGSTGAPVWDPQAYERTRDLTGTELLDALGAVSVELVPGTDVGTWDGHAFSVNGAEVPGCPASGAPEYVLIGRGDGTFACVGVVDGEQAADVAQRASA